ncbi:MAG: YkgJ family cysteine cluster protein [Methanosarcinales archaeon]|nr:YkgJ family cysteine cluster protein [Methanosarcinales archaeon]
MASRGGAHRARNRRSGQLHPAVQDVSGGREGPDSHDEPGGRASHLKTLTSELEMARALDILALAGEILKEGFRCTQCGRCCRGEELSVLAFPGEVRGIMAHTGQSWLEVAEPPLLGEWDRMGNFHTLEWRLQKTPEGDCQFYHRGCKIYDHRPLLCRTYPFYLEEGRLVVSRCEGLGQEMEAHRALDLAGELKRRYVREMEEAIDLVMRYRDFERGPPSRDGACLVHDSEGQHRLSWDRLPGMLDRLCPASRDR